ncbi:MULTISPECIES: NAD-dependent epimerase/dehydratase family protein [unclassified Chitinophaga]|uniref:NAD-dependent epimerase/dehydratase family protein n=1 Tax=unclassified Chitinophaga TaxID=2619133 RepID=UPI0009C855D1|nr:MULTISPECIES: NAD-dependent epimerase/dehydratase family protein [unclassified Chitinophaga]OMP74605.1 NAD-dependent dehydratase [[Flexibacter] sp. ATCC 35208]WPV70280.1 NAD-dependent epimerase/dehydratase family protein [Chitinophaga sp. LS1]
MQTILGSGGAIGTPLARELKAYTDKIRLVARKPVQVNGDDELITADLTNVADVDRAVAGSEVVYLTVGLEYNIKVWRRDWPVIMKNVIDACVKHNARLVFLDNVYMYGKNEIPHMTESSTIAPPSKKGEVRAALHHMLLQAKGLKVAIARSADFYGPGVKNGMLTITVQEEFKKGKKAYWQLDPNKIHTFTYTPDAAKGTAIIGNTPDAFGQVWHLPTSSEKVTGKEFIERIAGIMQVKPKYYILARWMMGLMGLFVPIVKEIKEMSYQYDRDYIFDSSKFEKRFNFKPTTYATGLPASVAS